MGWFDTIQGPGYQSDAARAFSQQQVETTREQPERFQMERQQFQTEQQANAAALKQAQMLNEMMRRQMDPQNRLMTANLVTKMIDAAKDPMSKARLQFYQGMMLNGQITPEAMMSEISKFDEFKVMLEQAKAQQAVEQAALNAANAQITGKVGAMLPSAPGATPSPTPAPSASGGLPAGFRRQDVIMPDGSHRTALIGPGNRFIDYISP